jgi:1-deoxy-D-xylulose-5-phosphate synthase
LEDVASLFVEEQLPSPDLFSVYQAKPLPDGLVRMLLGKGYRFIVTIEENQLEGGVGMSLLNTLYEKGYRGNILRLGIPDEFVDTVGDEAFLRARVGLDAQSIFERIMQAFEANNG